MFEPSFVLLILKTISIFLISMSVGWSLSYIRITRSQLINWVFYTILGAAFLNFSCMWAVLLGYHGAIGVLPPLVLILIKVITSIRNGIFHNFVSKYIFRKTFFTVFILSFISCINYLAPFAIEMTSGYYARGGGDHSTYMVLSDYFLDHNLWEQLSTPPAAPPKMHWEADQYAQTKSKFYPPNTQPFANQFVATPFMAILPGLKEETYTASVAFYITMAIWSVIALLMLFFNRKNLSVFLFSPLFLSNLVIYNATVHSIPYLLAIAMINLSLMLFFIYTRNYFWSNNIKDYIHYLPLGVLCSALLAIYPHGWVMLMFFVSIMALCSRSPDIIKRYLLLGTVCLIFSFATVNILLISNIPLIFTGLGLQSEFTTMINLIKIIGAHTGVLDLLMNFENKNKLYTIYLSGIFLILIYFVYYALAKEKIDFQKRISLLFLLFIPWAAIIYYLLRGHGSYQIVRFLEFVHLYILAIAGFGLMRFRKEKNIGRTSILVSVFVLSIISGELLIRSHTVSEVLSVTPVFGTEFRDSAALMGVKKIEQIQNKSSGDSINHVAYYFGPGDGVDFAGGSVMLRNLHYMPARGNTLANWFDNVYPDAHVRAWNKEWLDHAFLVIRPESTVDVIDDRRSGALSRPLLDTERLKIYASDEQPITQLVGDSWFVPKFYPSEESIEAKPYRYLRGNTAAIVIWSQKPEQVKLALYMSSESDNSKIKINSDLLKEKTTTMPVEKWQNIVPEAPSLTLTLNLVPGANVLELTPESDTGHPWMFLWKVSVI